jgi:peptidoglycan/xylan/chitin deacetylase (PgdA/CDA1 family)
MAVNNVNYNDSLREGTDKINQSINQSNQAIDKANSADTKADSAISTANQANTKSDDTQQQLNNIVINNGESDAEVLQARGTYSVLNERLSATDDNLLTKADKSEITDVNDRIDQIITSPAEGISEQEIIDARQGETSLGGNISKIKSQVEHSFANIIQNGDFQGGVVGWTPSNSTHTVIGGVEVDRVYRVNGLTSQQSIQSIQTIAGGFTGGDKLYVKADVRNKGIINNGIYIEFYRSSYAGATVVSTKLPHPPNWVWTEIEDVVTLANDGVGDLSVQLKSRFDTVRDLTNEFFEVNNLIVINLTKTFGLGKEPDLDVISKVMSGFPNKFFNGETTLPEIQFNTLRALSENPVSVKRVNSLPLNKNKFDGSVNTILNSNSVIKNKTSMFVNNALTYNDEPTFQLDSYGGTSHLSANIATINFNSIDYVDFYLHVADLSKVTNIQIDFFGSDGYRLVSRNSKIQLSQLRADASGLRYIRIPVREFVIVNAGLGEANEVKVSFSGGGVSNLSSINIHKIDVVTQDKGTIYLYFDDATLDHYTNAFPIMEKYGLRGTVAVPTETTHLPGKASWSQLREMHNAGWLMVSHGLDEASLAAVTPEEAERQIKNSSQMLYDRGFHFGSKCIVAPQGSWSDVVDNIAKKYLALCRTKSYYNAGKDGFAMEFPQSHPRVQYYKSPVETTTLEECKGWVDNAINTKQELSLAWHKIDNPPPDEYATTVEFFEEICSYIRQKIDEGVLRSVTWQDTMLQSGTVNLVDTEGEQYLVSDNGNPTVLTLPIE